MYDIPASRSWIFYSFVLALWGKDGKDGFLWRIGYYI